MPLYQCQAIVLRTYRVGEADKIVVFLTRTMGKVRGMARGARRTKSRFGAGLEVGTEVALTFFEKEGQELVSVDRCDILQSGFTRLGDPLLACTLAYFTDLVDAFAPEREPNERLYRLLSASTTALGDGVHPELMTRYFEAWLLRLGGVYPLRRSCSACGGKLTEGGASYQIEDHRILCRRCGERGLPLSAGTLEFLESVWREPPRAVPEPGDGRALEELSVLHQKLIGHQIDKDLSSHQVLQDLVRLGRKR